MLHNVWLLYNESMLYIVILNQVLLSQLGFMLIVGNGVPMEEREDRREEKLLLLLYQVIGMISFVLMTINKNSSVSYLER